MNTDLLELIGRALSALGGGIVSAAVDWKDWPTTWRKIIAGGPLGLVFGPVCQGWLPGLDGQTPYWRLIVSSFLVGMLAILIVEGVFSWFEAKRDRLLEREKDDGKDA